VRAAQSAALAKVCVLVVVFHGGGRCVSVWGGGMQVHLSVICFLQ
jgi:hypothetical protein